MINADKPQYWNSDTQQSVLQYNEWFLAFAPQAFRSARTDCIGSIDSLFAKSDYLRSITPSLIIDNPSLLSMLRMLCAPPIARDRLAGLAGVPKTVVKTLEEGRLPSGQKRLEILKDEHLPKLFYVLHHLMDHQLVPWVTSMDNGCTPHSTELKVAKAVLADRVTGSLSNPIIRNAQEERQLKVIREYLEQKGYYLVSDSAVGAFEMEHGTFSYHKPVRMFKNAVDDTEGYVMTPVDVVIMPQSRDIKMPVFVECKSAGDFTNTNKRRKEEDTKVTQLRATYGDDVILHLFLCGYFDATYLGYEAANHMDWVWEHRVTDFKKAGL